MGSKTGQGLFVALVLFTGYLFYTRRLEAFSAILRYGPGGPPSSGTQQQADQSAAAAMPGLLAPMPVIGIKPRDPGINPAPGSGIVSADIAGPGGSVHVQISKVPETICIEQLYNAGLEVGLSPSVAAVQAYQLCNA